MKSNSIRILIEGAIVASICFVLNITIGRIFIWPPSLATTPLPYFNLVPLVSSVYAYRRGMVPVIYMSLVLMIINIMATGQIWFAPVDNNFIVALDLLLEYPLAYLVYALPGLFANQVREGSVKYFVYGMILFGITKWIIHGSAGFFWQSAYVQGEHYKGAFFIFSFFIFNIAYVINTGLSIVVGVISYNRLKYIINKL